MSRACNAAISVLPRRLPPGGRLWLDFRAPERPRSSLDGYVSLRTKASERTRKVARARESICGRPLCVGGHGAEDRGAFCPRFRGGGGGLDNAARFCTKESPATPRDFTMRLGGAPAFSGSESGRCFRTGPRCFFESP